MKTIEEVIQTLEEIIQHDEDMLAKEYPHLNEDTPPERLVWQKDISAVQGFTKLKILKGMLAWIKDEGDE